MRSQAARPSTQTTPENDPLADALAALERMQAALALMEEMFAALSAQLALTRDLVESLEDQIDDLVNPDPDPDETGRLVITTDGNDHDQDDILAAPMSLALIAATGRQDELELMIYNDHIWGSDPEKKAKMTESVQGARERFEFDDTRFVSGVDYPNWAVTSLVREINESSASNPLTILMGGPSHTTAKAVAMANQDKLQHVTVVSHAAFNENHAATHGSPYTWSSMQDTDVTLDEIPDQNRLLNTSENAWDWMQETPDLAWVYSRNQKSDFDTSDSGMAYYYLTGDQAGTPAKFQDILT